MRSNPLVTVIISSYNHEKYARRMIESVLGQTYQNLEVLVIDDCSSDKTFDILSEYANDKRLFLKRNVKNRQVVNNINECLSRANGEYITFIGSDDAWDKNKIEKQVEFLEAHKEFAGCFTKCKLIDEHDNFWPKENAEFAAFKYDLNNQSSALRFSFDFGNPFMHPSAMLRKSVVEEIGPFNAILRQTHDFEYWIKILLRYPLATIQEPLLIYRFERDEKHSMSSANKPGFIRTANEFMYIIYMMSTKISDELFRETFADKFNDDGWSKEDILCKKFLLLRNWGFLVEKNSALAQRFLFEYCNDDKILELLDKKYNIKLADVYSETGKLIQPYPIDYYPDYNMLQHSCDEWHRIADERLQLINDLKNSASWKATKPLRAAGRVARKLKGNK